MKRRIEAQEGGDIELPELPLLTPEFEASTIQVTVIGANGRLRATAHGKTAGIDLSTWESFAVHRDNPSAGLYVGKPVKGLLSKGMAIPVSRRLEKPGGGFAGVLVFSLDPDLFTALHRNVNLGATGAMTLVGTDAIVRARYSSAKERPVPVGASLARAKSLADALTAERGAYIGPCVVDGAMRIADWRKVSGYPLLVIVGFGRDEVLADANRHAFIVLGLGFVAIFLTALMAAMIVREVSQRVRHEIALQEESHKLSLANQNLERQHAALLAASTELAAERVNLQNTNAGLLLAQQRSEAANRAKTAFLANMSHELRTPLNAIIGFSEIIRDKMFGPDSPAYFDYAGDINNAGVHLLNIINNVLDVAKIESGKVELSDKPHSLTSILEASLRSVKVQATNGGLKILGQYPRDEISILCDRTRLKQAIINILSNAVKFTPEGGRIELRQSIEASGEVCIAIKDTGIGMTEAEIVAAFEQFRQIDNSYHQALRRHGARAAAGQAARRAARRNGYGDEQAIGRHRGAHPASRSSRR